jgi:hypothetical protein
MSLILWLFSSTLHCHFLISYMFTQMLFSPFVIVWVKLSGELLLRRVIWMLVVSGKQDGCCEHRSAGINDCLCCWFSHPQIFLLLS